MTDRLRIARALLICATALGGVALTPVPASAQTTTARIVGRVVSASGQPVTGATITARDVGTNRTVTRSPMRAAVTSSTGCGRQLTK